MRVELHPTTSAESYFRILPRYKVRSIGDLVRAQDEIVLERADARGQYLGVSRETLRTKQVHGGGRPGLMENEFCLPNVHEVSASVNKAAFVLQKYKAQTIWDPRIPAIGSLEASISPAVVAEQKDEDEVEQIKPINAGDVIQLFHKDSDCYVSAEGVFADPDAPTAPSTLREDMHLRHRAPNEAKPNRLKPPTSAVSYFQVEMVNLYEGGVITWKTKVRFRHVTSRMYLSIGKLLEQSKESGALKEYGTCLVTEATADTLFYVRPVVQDSDFVPTDSYVRIQHCEKQTWLHATQDVIKRGERSAMQEGFGFDADSAATGLHRAGSVTWDNAELRSLVLSEAQYFQDAFSTHVVPHEHVHSVAFVAGVIPILRQYVKRRGLRELTQYEATITTTALNELRNFLFDRGIEIKQRQKMLRDVKLIDIMVEVLQAPFHPDCVGAEDKEMVSNTTSSGIKSFDDVLLPQNRNTMLVMNAVFRVLNACVMGDSRKMELFLSRHVPFFWTMFGTEMRVEPLLNELLRDNNQIIGMCGETEVAKVMELLKAADGKREEYLEFFSVLCVCGDAPVKEKQDLIGKMLLSLKEPPVFLTRVKPGTCDGIEVTTTGDWKDAEAMDVFASTALDERDDTSTAEYLFLQRQLELYGNLCKGRHAENINYITEVHKHLTWEECFLCVQSDWADDIKTSFGHGNTDLTNLVVGPPTMTNDQFPKADLIIHDVNHKGPPTVSNVKLPRLPRSLRRLYVNLIVNLFVDAPPKPGPNAKANRDVLSELELTFDWEELKYNYYEEAAKNQTMALSGATFVHFPVVKRWISGVLKHTGSIVHVDDQVGQPKNKLLTSVLELLLTLIRYGYYADQKDIVELMGDTSLKSVIDGTNDRRLDNTAEQPLSGITKRKSMKKGTMGAKDANKAQAEIKKQQAAAAGAEADSEEAHVHWLHTGRYTTDNEHNAVVVKAKYAALLCVDALFNFVFNVRLRFLVCDFKLAKKVKRKETIADENRSRKDELEGSGMIEVMSEMMTSEWSLTADHTEEVRAYLVKLKDKCDWIDPGWLLKNGTETKHGDGSSLVGVLLDLARYKDDELMVKCLELINRIYSSQNDLLELAVQAQVLTTEVSNTLAHHAKDNVPVIKAIAQGVISGADVDIFNATVIYWTSKCYILGRKSTVTDIQFKNQPLSKGGWREPGLPNEVNQKILLNSGVVSVILDTVKIPNQPPSVLRNCFWLLRGLCVGYPDIQILLYEAVDTILTTTTTMEDHADEEAYEAWANSLGWVVSEIFNACRETCLRVTADQVEAMLKRVGAGSAEKTFRSARLLEACEAVSKVEEWDLPLKRNQALIMKYLWAEKSSVVDIADIDELSDPLINANRMHLLAPETANKLKKTYHLNLVSVLAACCEGENRQIESMCRSIFTLEELVTTLAAPTGPPGTERSLLRPTPQLAQYIGDYNLKDHQEVLAKLYTGGAKGEPTFGRTKFGAEFKGIAHEDKCSYMLFFLWSFLNTKSTSIEIGTNTLHTNEMLFEALVVIAIEEISKYAKILDSGNQLNQSQAKFAYDAFIPIIEKLASEEHYPKTSAPVSQGCMIIITEVLVDFLKKRDGHQDSHLNRFRNNVVVRAMTALKERLSKTDLYKNKHMLNSTLADVSRQGLEFTDAGITHDKALKGYQDEYKDELEVNANFNSFVGNLKIAYESENTVGMQLGPLNYPGMASSNSDEYSDPKGTMLPAGPEFQYLVNLFCEFTKGDATLYQERLGVLVRLWEAHKIVSAGASQRELEALHNVTNKSLEVVLAGVHNAKLIATGNADAEIQVQDQIVKAGSMLPIAFLMASNSYQVQQEALATLHCTMDGGNQHAQEVFEHHFYDTREEIFFESVAGLLTLGMESVSELRILVRQKEEADKQQEKLRQTMTGTIKALQNKGKSEKQRATAESAVSGTETPYGSNGAKYIVNEAEADDGMVVVEKNPFNIGSGSHGHLGPLLNVLQAMCEGNNDRIQDFFRTQSNNIKSFNLVTMVSQVLMLLVQDVVPSNVSMIAQAVGCLNEFCQGNGKNQRDIFNARIFDSINVLLRVEYGELEEHKAYVRPSQRTKEAHKVTAKGAVYALNGDGELQYDVSVIELHMQAAILLGRMLETNDSDTSYLAVQIDSMIELSFILRLMREYVGLAVHLAKKGITSLDLPVSGKVGISDIYFLFYFVVVRLEWFTKKSYHLDKRLRVSDEEYIADHGDLDTMNLEESYVYVEKRSCSIEIEVDGAVQQLYFMVQDHWRINHDDRESILWSVDRAGVTEQVEEFMGKSKTIAATMKHKDRYRKSIFGRFFLDGKTWIERFFLLMSAVVNLAMVLTWVAPHDRRELKPVLDMPGAIHSLTTESNESVVVVMELLGIVHLISTIFLVISFFVVNPPTLGAWFSGDAKVALETEEVTKTKQGKVEDLDIIRELRAAHFVDENRDIAYTWVFSGLSLYYIAILVCSILGNMYSGYTFAFCLLHIVVGNDILERVGQSVTANGTSLLWVALLLVIVIYIYSLAGFAFYRDFYDRDEGAFCYTMVECFASSLRLGLVSGGGIGDALPWRENDVPAFAFHGGSRGSGMPAGRLLFDLSFFVLVTIVGMNVVFGIIVDTFSELREDKNKTEDKMTSECFICGLKSSDFDRFGHGWKHHIKKEHHMWNYMYLLRHFDEKDATEFTYLEQYVAEKIFKAQNEFYPFGKALSLAHKPEIVGADENSTIITDGVGAGAGGDVTNTELFAMLTEQQAMIAAIVQKLSKDDEFDGFGGGGGSSSGGNGGTQRGQRV
jgi:hypothetical protein